MKSLAFLQQVAHDRKAAIYAAEHDGKMRNFAYHERLGECRETFSRLLGDVQKGEIGVVMTPDAACLSIETSPGWMEAFIQAVKQHEVLIGDHSHDLVYDLRDDVLHKLTTRLATCYGMIGIEDLNLKGLLKNRKLARSFSDAALGKLLALLMSKMEQRGGQVIKVGRFFPSSKTCHSCGWKWEDMQLSDRVFLCQNPDCAYYQFAQDRDHNAALCILAEALRLIGLLDQAVSGTGSDEDANLAADAG